jgi:hypothetical protein
MCFLPLLQILQSLPVINGGGLNILSGMAHKWVILRMMPTLPLNYHSCKKHERAQASSTLLEDLDPVNKIRQNINTIRRKNLCC